MSRAVFVMAVLMGSATGLVRAQDNLPPVPVGLSERELAERAEAAFAEGVRLRHARDKAQPHFREAAAHFDELRRRGAHNAILYRNLGNAYLLAGDLPHAILSYRRGLRVAPLDRALRENLAQARERVEYPAASSLGRPPISNRPPWLPQMEGGFLVAAAAVLYALAWVALTRWLMVRRRRLLAAGIAGLIAAALLTIVICLGHDSEQESSHPLVVIADDGVLLRKGNGLTFPPRYSTPLARGVEARLLFERGDWLQIELAGGEVGWVPAEYALVDRP